MNQDSEMKRRKYQLWLDTHNDHIAEKKKAEIALVTKRVQGMQRNAKKPRVATRDEVARR